MIRYAYNRQVDPPTPFVHVSLRRPGDGPSLDDLPAQVDTTADRTVIPGGLVARLGLVPLDELAVAGFGGQVLLVSTYLVDLAIRGRSARPIEVIAHEGEPYILLGRDVLNYQQAPIGRARPRPPDRMNRTSATHPSLRVPTSGS